MTHQWLNHKVSCWPWMVHLKGMLIVIHIKDDTENVIREQYGRKDFDSWYEHMTWQHYEAHIWIHIMPSPSSRHKLKSHLSRRRGGLPLRICSSIEWRKSLFADYIYIMIRNMQYKLMADCAALITDILIHSIFYRLYPCKPAKWFKSQDDIVGVCRLWYRICYDGIFFNRRELKSHHRERCHDPLSLCQETILKEI